MVQTIQREFRSRGVETDVKASAPDALVTAEKLAQDKLQNK
jgi:hypothetical protein